MLQIQTPDATLAFGEDQEVLVGRSRCCDVRIKDPFVSKVHCRFHWCGVGWSVEDHNSTNGTRLNGERVHYRLIQPGDIISVGVQHSLTVVST